MLLRSSGMTHEMSIHWVDAHRCPGRARNSCPLSCHDMSFCAPNTAMSAVRCCLTNSSAYEVITYCNRRQCLKADMLRKPFKDKVQSNWCLQAGSPIMHPRQATARPASPATSAPAQPAHRPPMPPPHRRVTVPVGSPATAPRRRRAATAGQASRRTVVRVAGEDTPPQPRAKTRRCSSRKECISKNFRCLGPRDGSHSAAYAESVA